MATQMVFRKGQTDLPLVKYNPCRDVAYCWDDLLRSTCTLIERREFAEVGPFIAEHNVTDDELTDVLVFLAEFWKGSRDGDREPLHELQKRGWFELRWQARAAVLSMMGQMMLGFVYSGIRQATEMGDVPMLPAVELTERAAALAALCGKPLWRRKLALLSMRFKRWVLRVLRLRD